MSTELKKYFSPEAIAALDAHIKAIAAESAAPTPRILDEPYISIKRAAILSDHPPQTIRKWLAQGRIRRYGQPRSPRVLLSEILKLK